MAITGKQESSVLATPENFQLPKNGAKSSAGVAGVNFSLCSVALPSWSS